MLCTLCMLCTVQLMPVSLLQRLREQLKRQLRQQLRLCLLCLAEQQLCRLPLWLVRSLTE